ncbi:unnamed protein product, partial [marine sediment metagenome]
RDFQWNAQQYEQMPWLYSAIFQISTSIARLPWQITKKTRLTEAEMKDEEGDSKFKVEDITDNTDNPLVALLMQPNAEMTWFDFMESVCSFIELSGNAYVELSKNAMDQIGDMYIMRPDRMKVLAGEDNKLVAGYEFKVSKASEGTHFDAKDVMHIKTFNPTDDWYGLASVKPATLSLSLEDAARKFNTEFFLNDATPGGVLSTEAAITKEDAERIEERWRTRNAAGKRRRTVILPFGIEYKMIGTEIKDIEFEGLMKQTTQEQLAVTGVPPAKVGLLQFAKYSNYEIQNRAFYEDTIEPKIMKIQSSINLSIVSRFDDKEEGVTYHF